MFMEKIFTLLFSLVIFSASAQTVTESFEGWDGTTNDWLPEGWTEVHNSDPYISTFDTKGNCTWHVINPDASTSLPNAKDGKYYMAIGYARDSSTKKDYEQDEMVISPVYRLSSFGGTLNYEPCYNPMYLFILDDDHIDWSDADWPTFIQQEGVETVQECSATLQTYVRIVAEDGTPGEWEGINNLFSEWLTYDFGYFWNYMNSNEFHSQSTIFLTDEKYHDALVQVGFRYVGSQGGIIGIDNFMMGYATPEGIGTVTKKVENESIYQVNPFIYVKNGKKYHTR